MTYKDSDQRTKDYLGKFTKDKVVQNLMEQINLSF